MAYEKLSKNALKCMYTATGLGAITMIAILTGIMCHFSLFTMPLAVGIYLFLTLLMSANGIVSPPFRYQRYRYAITDECIEIREGYLWVEEHLVPINRLHQIAISQGPIDRIYGLTKVVVTTAGGEVTIRFLETQKAQDIADTLKIKINQLALLQQTGDRHE